MILRALLLILVLAFPVCSQSLFKVGMVTRNFTDAKRQNWQANAPRPLRTMVWYPVVANTPESETIFGGSPDQEIFVPVTVAGDAKISDASRRYPLILLSHGTGGSAVQMMWLGKYLASRGYITAAVNHHGNTGAEDKPTPQGFRLIWERARDMSVLLDKLLVDPLFGPRIDRKRIGAAGFSLGGYTVISIAGGRLSVSEFDAFCSSPQRDFTCEPQPEFPEAASLFEKLRTTDAVVQESIRHSGDSFRDPRIKRVFAIAPAMGGGFTKAGLSEVRIPVFIVVGEEDRVAPPLTNAQRYAQLIKTANLKILPGHVGHYIFLAECNPHGKAVAEICRDDISIDRTQVHQQVAQLAFQFFDEEFGP
jgi:predicted dienelactone hydrolase